MPKGDFPDPGESWLHDPALPAPAVRGRVRGLSPGLVHTQACQLKTETITYEEKEQQLVNDCVKELSMSLALPPTPPCSLLFLSAPALSISAQDRVL